MYTCFGLAVGAAIGISKLLDATPFRSNDMRNAYIQGCHLASRPVTEIDVEKCAVSADMFKDTLESIDRQMNE